MCRDWARKLLCTLRIQQISTRGAILRNDDYPLCRRIYIAQLRVKNYFVRSLIGLTVGFLRGTICPIPGIIPCWYPNNGKD
jgi:hypothetical protein